MKILQILLFGLFCLQSASGDYKKNPNVTGSLSAVGSDTMNNLMAYWQEAFLDIYPDVTLSVESKGSSAVAPALIENTAELGPMSRLMKPSELDSFEAKFGYRPTAIKVALDAIVLFVHKDNPTKALTLQQLDNLFSCTYRRGGKPTRGKWDETLTSITNSPWNETRLSLYGRNSASGTYGFFEKIVLLKGDFKPRVKEQPGSSAVVQSIATDRGGIGYSSIGYKTSGVNILALKDEMGVAVFPTAENCLSGRYPLTRFLYLYVNKSPDQPLPPLTLEFITFTLSKQGQDIVKKEGYFPLPLSVIEQSLAEITN